MLKLRLKAQAVIDLARALLQDVDDAAVFLFRHAVARHAGDEQTDCRADAALVCDVGRVFALAEAVGVSMPDQLLSSGRPMLPASSATAAGAMCESRTRPVAEA